MKHIFLFQRFFASLLLLAVSTLSWAYDFAVDGIYCNKNSDGKSVTVTYGSTKHNSYSGSITIPASVIYSSKIYRVTGIGISAFRDCTGLTSITIPNTVTSISDEAFYNCSGLVSVTIPEGVISIGYEAFRGCSGLTSVVIGNSVKSISAFAFSGCSGLTRAEFGSIENLCKISFNSYESNPLNFANHLYIKGEEVKDLVIPSNVKTIGKYAFYNCSGLKTVSIKSGVTSIGDEAFRNCDGLTSIEIPNSVTSIGSIAFCDCDGLTSVSIPESVTNIGGSAFGDCSSLISVAINSDAILSKSYSIQGGNGGISSIFAHSVKEFTIGESVTSIGDNTFYNCSGLTSINIPNSVTRISKSAFTSCYKLSDITINSNAVLSKSYSSSDNLNDIFPNLVSKRYIIGGDVTSIGDYAFYNVDITSVVIKNGVKKIGRYAFANCATMKYISIPESVHFVGVGAFENCQGVFYDNLNLRYVEDCLIEVLDKTLSTYTIEEGTNLIADGVFSNMTNLKILTIPDGITSIGGNAFYNCSGLTSISIPKSLTYIGNSAFNNCTSLKSIKIPEGMLSISSSAFSGCSSLASIIIPNSVLNINGEAFKGCSSLASVIIPNNVTNIGNSAFSECISLTSIIIPENVVSIGEKAFSACSGLISITLPKSIASVGKEILNGCSNLMSVTCKAANIPITGENAFYEVPQRQATLYVPEGSIDAYKEAEQWNKFRTILPISGSDPEIPQCAKPTIKYNNGKLSFESETEGVDFVSEIMDSDVKKHNGAEIDLTVTYNLTVYATKAGYDNSEVATATLCWIDASPEGEGFVNGVAELEARPVILQTRGNIIDITGVKDGEEIKVYGVGGQLAGSAKASDESVSVSTTLNGGSIAIVKIGEKSVKIVMK